MTLVQTHGNAAPHCSSRRHLAIEPSTTHPSPLSLPSPPMQGTVAQEQMLANLNRPKARSNPIACPNFCTAMAVRSCSIANRPQDDELDMAARSTTVLIWAVGWKSPQREPCDGSLV
jgi:hypothetical protein